MKTLALTVMASLLAFCALGQNPISVRTTNGEASNLTISNGLTVTGGIVSDTFTGNGANLTGIPSGLNTNYFSTNLIPAGAVYDANDNYALSGITVGAVYFIHIGNVTDWPPGTSQSFMRDLAVYYSNGVSVVNLANNTTNGAEAMVVAGSNTFYLTARATGVGSIGSNILTRIYLINTNSLSYSNTIAGNFNGNFNGVLSSNTLTNIILGNSLVESTNVGTLTDPLPQEFYFLRTSANTSPDSGNTALFRSTATDGKSYSGFAVHAGNGVGTGAEYFAMAIAADGNYLASSNFPYGTPYIETYTGAYSFFFVDGSSKTVWGGWSKELSGSSTPEFVAFKTSLETTTNYALLSETNALLHVRQSDSAVVVSNLTVKGTATFTNGVIGSTASNNATAGNLGEFVQTLVSQGSAVTCSTGVITNVAQIILTAGDWDVDGNVNITNAAATVTQAVAGIWPLTLVSTGLPTDGSEVLSSSTVTTSTDGDSITLPRKRIVTAATTTNYLAVRMTFSAGTVKAYGQISARRMR